MSTLTLLGRSLRYYWRTHLGVLLGTALGSLVLLGALLVGDSVKATLLRQAMERVGKVQSALIGGDHFFRAQLGAETGSVPILLLRGSLTGESAGARANNVQVVGVPPDFWALAPGAAKPPELAGARAIVNRRLADQLQIAAGSTLVLRLEKPSAFSKDAPLSGAEDQAVALRVECAAIADAGSFGNFSLQANQVPPTTIFLPIAFLQERLGLAGKANLLLNSSGSPASLQAAINPKRTLADAELELRPLANPGTGIELRTSRVFLEPPVVDAAPAGLRALTYLVNELRAGEKMAPYSMATAVDAGPGSLVPAGMKDDEVAINQWLAEDLGVGVGAPITLKYFVMGERRQLEERAREFKVAAILPMNTPGLDSTWMPDFPGLSDKKNCRDWEPGFAMDTGKIRPKDEQYWNDFRGTPKAFLTLKAGQEMWGNRWGNLTAIRYPATARAEQIASDLLAKLSPEKMGMKFVALREQAIDATNAPVPFGVLFLSFSCFLLTAAAVLTGLLFVFSLEQRNEEAGLLLGLGWPAAKVRRLLLSEGAALAVIGSMLGALGGVGYTWLILRALATVWRSAVGDVEFSFSASPLTLATAILSSVVIALAAMWLASRRQLRQTAQALLAGRGEMGRSAQKPRRSWSLGIAIVAAVAAVGIVAFDHAGGGEAFFSAGALLLIAGIAAALDRLRRRAALAGDLDSIGRLGIRNAARRRGRSVATIGVLASGVFMVLAVDAFRQRGPANPADRHSGTGGFTYLAEAATPLYEDLNTPAGLEASNLDPKKLAGVHFVPMRVREGDDASCLNLNRALQPRLLGVKPSDLASLDAFRFADRWKGAANSTNGWTLLDGQAGEGEAVPAIVDAGTLEWALQKKLGDVLLYQDDRGRTFQVRLVATVANSVLQGSVLISEANFQKHFPNQGGYRFFLIDTPPGAGSSGSEEIRKELNVALGDRGFEVIPAVRRLQELQAVENTYLAIFQALGGLGLLLGTAGLAIVVARNVLERRGEFGLLEAVGFRPTDLRRLVFAEHRWLIFVGLGVGVISALVAIWPNLSGQSHALPLIELAIVTVAMLGASLLWTWLATRLSLRGDRIAALRNE